MEPLPAEAVPRSFRLTPDPLTIGLSMVNWLVLMLLLSGFLLASTTSDIPDPAGTSAGLGTTTAR